MFAAGAPWLWALLSFGAPVDKQLECSSWAERGECASNPAYMLKHCAASCAGADTNKAKHDSQMLRECEGYARQGECSRNPAFMLSSCRTQCEAWEKQHGLKMDLDSRCVGWSLLGQCERERETMSRTCNTSCTVHERCAQSNLTGWSIGICDKALRCEALDSARDCSHLAATGACRSDAARMAQKCLRTCAAIDVDGVLGAHRPEMRVRLSRTIDVPSTLTRAHARCWLSGWSGHNEYKLMLPTTCASALRPWERARLRRLGVPPVALTADADGPRRCPVAVNRHTPRVQLPSRAVRIEPHTLQEVRVVQVLASPRVRLLEDFVTAEEAEEVLKLASTRFARSPVRSVATDRRTSSTATIFEKKNWAVSRIRERISAFSGYDQMALEPLQVVRYHPGEKYEPHHDLFDICDFPQKPRRQLTFLIYLNELPEGAGGETSFPRLNMRIKPKAYSALVFNDVLDNGLDDERTEHGGSAPTEGVKYAINCWIRAKEGGASRGASAGGVLETIGESIQGALGMS